MPTIWWEKSLKSPEPRSIHYRRRWAYTCWVVLLLLALGALGAWRIPGSRGEGQVTLSLRLLDAPAGTRVDFWRGPSSAWKPGRTAYLQGGAAAQDGSLALGPIPILVARRRWLKLLHPDTTDRIMLRLSAPGGRVAFASYSLAPDLNAGLLGERRKMKVWLPLRWGALSQNEASPFRIQ